MSGAGSFRRLSAPGAAALSIWRLEGSVAALCAAAARRALPPVDRPVLASLRDARDGLLDQGVFWLRASGPPCVAEWHLHGGYGVAAALRSRLLELGWREERGAPDADRRRFLEARGPLNARVAAEALDGVFERAWQGLPGHDPEGRARAVAGMHRWDDWARVLDEPPAVVLAGPPNAGKSTLFNARLREERVTVSPHPGTTRDSVTAGILLGAGDDAFEAWLTDTAGLWSEARGLDGRAVEQAQRSLRRAWRVIWVLDAAQAPGGAARQALEQARESDLRLLHRCDLGEAWCPEDELGGNWLRASSRAGASPWQQLDAALLATLGTPPPPGAPLPLGAERRRRLQQG